MSSVSPRVASLKQRIAELGLLAPKDLSDRDKLAVAVSEWFRANAADLLPLEQVQLLYHFKREVKFGSGRLASDVEWLVELVGALVAAESLAESGWPPPIQFQVGKMFGMIDRLGEYVLLYEVFIHFHFVTVASQFMWMTAGLDPKDEPRSALLGYQILHQTLNCKNCRGGRVWLDRAAGISWVGHELVREKIGKPAPFPELFDLLEPAKLEVAAKYDERHPSFVQKSGPAYAFFELLQEIRNRLMAHHDECNRSLQGDGQRLGAGLSVLANLLGTCLAPYLQLGLALVGYNTGGKLLVECMWSTDGGERLPSNNSARTHFRRIWGDPEPAIDRFSAPTPPPIEGWSWDDSLLLFQRDDARNRYLYLMPLGYRYKHDDTNTSILPGLLDSVHWQRRSRQLTIIQRKYERGDHLDSVWSDPLLRPNQLPVPRDQPAAYANVRMLVERMEQLYGFELQAGEDEVSSAPQQIFELGHANYARGLLERTVPREAEVQRILTKAKFLAARSIGCARLLLVGPSGIGKSVLMAQIWAKVQHRALFFTMDQEPSADFEPEPVAATRSGAGGGELDPTKREESIGVPVRMHWLAGARRLARRPPPDRILGAAEVHRQLVSTLQTLLGANATEPVYIFVDAVNQAKSPASLFQGLRPFATLPKNVVLIASSQDIASVLSEISDDGRSEWEKIEAKELANDEVRELLRRSFRPAEPPPSMDEAPLRPSAALPEPLAMSDELVEFVRAKSSGLALLVSYWGKRLAALWQRDPSRAEHAFQRELDRPAAELLPRDYFERIRKVDPDFRPQALFDALFWCFCLINRPLATADIEKAVAAIRPHLPNLPPVSKYDIEMAVNRLGGFLTNVGGPERTVRLAHPLVGEAWLGYFGTPERISAVNVALLPCSAVPLVGSWTPSERLRWLNLFSGDDDRAYAALELDQKQALLKGLERCLETEPAFGDQRHKRALLVAELSSILRQLKRLDEACRLAECALTACKETIGLSQEKLDDLQWYKSTAHNALGVVAWDRGDFEGCRRELEESLKLRLACVEKSGLSPRRAAGLATAYRNLGIAAASVSGASSEQAALLFNRAIGLLAPLDHRNQLVGAALANAKENLAQHYAHAGKTEDATRLYSAVIELRTGLDSTVQQNRRDLANAYFGRALSIGGSQAISDYTMACQCLEILDQSSAERRNEIANIYFNRGVLFQRNKDWHGALRDYSRVLELHSDKATLMNCRLNRADVYRAIEDNGKADRDLQLAVALGESLDPNAPEQREVLARAYGLQYKRLRQVGDPEADRLITKMSCLERVIAVPARLFETVSSRTSRNSPCILSPEERATIEGCWRASGRGFRPSPPIVDARVTCLPEFDGLLLLELRAGGEDHGDSLAYLFWREQSMILLDGNSSPFHNLVDWGWLKLDTVAAAKAYLKLFCTHVQGDEGVFTIVEDIADLPWRQDANPEKRQLLSRCLRPLNVVSEEGGGWIAEGFVLYSNVVFAAKFRLKGSVPEMVDDEPVAADLPVDPIKVTNGWHAAHPLPATQLPAQQSPHLLLPPEIYEAIEGKLAGRPEIALSEAEWRTIEQRWLDARVMRGLRRDEPWPRVSGGRVQRSSAIADGALLELDGIASDGTVTVARGIWRREGWIVFDGNSEPFHAAGTNGWLRSRTSDAALSYLRLFCDHVAGDDGVFLLVERLEDLPWLPGADAQVRSSVQEKLQSIELRPDEAAQAGEGAPAWIASGCVLYDRALFRAKFGIRGTTIEMINNERQIVDLPVRRIGIKDGWQVYL